MAVTAFSREGDEGGAEERVIQVLILEDRETDAELMMAEMRRAGIRASCQRVDNEQDFLQRLRPELDLILADYALPGFNGVSALLATRRRCPNVPFIFVSGTIGEETAVEALHYGAVDYVLKDRMSRLGPAVERALREAKLLNERRRAEQEKDAILNGLKDVIVESVDVQGRLVWGNEALLAEPGGERDGFCERLCRGRVGKGEERCAGCALTASLSAGSVKECEAQTADGRTYMVRSTPVRGAEGQVTGAIVMALNFTEKKKLQAQFIQAQKMEAIGCLAGGLAHDLGNELTVILCTAHLLLEGPKDPSKIPEMVRTVAEAATRSSQLTQQLLLFGRRAQLRPAAVRVSEFLAGVRGLLSPLMTDAIEVRVKDASEGAVMHIDPMQLQQAMINLAVNARDAMPHGGVLGIEATQVEADELFLAAHPEVSRGIYACLRVTDTGSGMDRETLQRVFEPFYTTKMIGQGTGLGLAMVDEFVKQSQGAVEIESSPGEGTVVSLYFPIATGVPAAEEGREEAPACQGHGTILLVEDGAAVREVLSRLLTEAGYQVVEASNLKDAEAAFQARRGAIDLVLSDVIMPGGSGVDLAERIRQAGSEVPILFMSGYAGRMLRQRGLDLRATEVLPKPFSHRTLLEKLQRLMAAQSV